MTRLVAAALLLTLAGCADLGRRPWQTDVQCLRSQMAAPNNYVFEAAASVCARYTNDGTFTQINSHLLPLNLTGAPDLQLAARGSDYPHTP